MGGGLYDRIKYSAIQLLVLFDALQRHLRPRRAAILSSIEGKSRSTKARTLCVFAHYDRHGMIDDYVVNYVAELSRLGCEVVFVSTAPVFGDDTVERVRPYCSRILWRENIGYDFGSWRDGLASCGDLSSYDRIVIANDSVYGPLSDLGNVFDEMEARAVPVWGITDSLRYSRHLQSYFMVFGRAVIESEAFRGFWRDLPDYRNKHVVILQCEVGLSRILSRAGFKLHALCDYRMIVASPRGATRNEKTQRMPSVPVNATHWNWRELIEDYGCPFVKVQLLRDNPKGIADAKHWQEIVGAVSNYDVGLIRRHLDRMRR